MNTNWPTKKLGEITDIRIGGTPSRTNSQYWGGNNPWGTISDLKGQTLYETKEYITDLGIDNSNVKPIPAGTTLMSFKLSIGKVATAGTEIYTNEAIAGLIPKTNEVQDKWLFYSLPTINYDKYVSGAAKGKTLNKAILQEVELPVPSLQNQQKIVGKLDAIRKAQELYDTQISKTEELFDALVKKEINIGNGKDILSTFIKLSSGKFMPNKNQIAYGGNGINGYTDLPLISKPTIVIGRVGAYCGNVHFVNVPSWISDNAIYVKEHAKEKISLEFLYYFLFVSNLHKFAGFSGQPKITQEPILNIKLDLPELKAQAKIVKKLDAVQEYKKLLLKNKSLLKELFDSVLYKSMNGEMD